MSAIRSFCKLMRAALAHHWQLSPTYSFHILIPDALKAPTVICLSGRADGGASPLRISKSVSPSDLNEVQYTLTQLPIEKATVALRHSYARLTPYLHFGFSSALSSFLNNIMRIRNSAHQSVPQHMFLTLL